jgi:DNA recombination protein RmuC
LGLLVGALGGVLLTYMRMQRQSQERLISLQEARALAEQKLAVVDAERSSLQVRLEEHKKDVQEIKEKIVLELSQAQQKSVLESSERLSKASKQSLENLLSPFQNQLKDLHEKIHRTYDIESRERLSLQEQIKMMAQVHEKMTVETSSLTKALRGDIKLQGDWGEITLRRVLEASGLREGLEYMEQGKGFGLRDDEGVLRKPDYLILLPENRQLIIDSKVVLTAYESFVRADTAEEKLLHQKEFMGAVNRHIEDLSKKDYSSLEGVYAPDFTLMFLPTDGAFALALQSEEQLHFKSWQKKVILTSPSLLLPILRTVEFMWRQDKQGKNAEKIADSAGKLYDKFVGFIEDLEEVQKQLQGSEKALDEAFLKLRDGKGNLVRRAEQLRDLGAKVKKQIPADWVNGLPEGETDQNV